MSSNNSRFDPEDPRYKSFGLLFGLSYSSYLVLNRSMLQAMPKEWETKFLELIKEFEMAFMDLPNLPDSFCVTAKDHKDKFSSDPYKNYRYPAKEIYQATEKAFGRGYDDPSDIRTPTH